MTQYAPGSYQIVFGGSLAGAAPTITAAMVAFTPGSVTVVPVTAAETTTSATVTAGTTNEPPITVTVAILGAADTQEIFLNSAVAGNTSFEVTFNGYTTGPISYTGTAADATAIQTALSLLPSVAGVGTITVTQITAGDYMFVFSNGLTGTPLSVSATILAGTVDTGTELSAGTDQLVPQQHGRRRDPVQFEFQWRHQRRRHLLRNPSRPHDYPKHPQWSVQHRGSRRFGHGDADRGRHLQDRIQRQPGRHQHGGQCRHPARHGQLVRRAGRLQRRRQRFGHAAANQPESGAGLPVRQRFAKQQRPLLRRPGERQLQQHHERHDHAGDQRHHRRGRQHRPDAGQRDRGRASITDLNGVKINLAGASATGTATQFALIFGSATTPAITYTGSVSTDAAAIQTALNTLVNSLGYAGSPVTVTGIGNEVFSVVFGGSMLGVNVSSLTGAIVQGSGTIAATDGMFSLQKEGTGTLVLASSDSYEGGTTINQGILNIQNSAALGLGGTTTTVLDGTQRAASAGHAGPVDVTNQNLILSGTGNGNTGALENVSGSNTWGSTSTSILFTSDQGFSPQTYPVGSVMVDVVNAADTLTIGSSIGQLPTQLQGLLAASPPGAEPECAGRRGHRCDGVWICQRHRIFGDVYRRLRRFRLSHGARGASHGYGGQRRGRPCRHQPVDGHGDVHRAGFARYGLHFVHGVDCAALRLDDGDRLLCGHRGQRERRILAQRGEEHRGGGRAGSDRQLAAGCRGDWVQRVPRHGLGHL